MQIGTVLFCGNMGGCNENPCKGNKTDAKNFIAFVALMTLRTKPESRRELIFPGSSQIILVIDLARNAC